MPRMERSTSKHAATLRARQHHAPSRGFVLEHTFRQQRTCEGDGFQGLRDSNEALRQARRQLHAFKWMPERSVAEYLFFDEAGDITSIHARKHRKDGEADRAIGGAVEVSEDVSPIVLIAGKDISTGSMNQTPPALSKATTAPMRDVGIQREHIAQPRLGGIETEPCILTVSERPLIEAAELIDGLARDSHRKTYAGRHVYNRIPSEICTGRGDPLRISWEQCRAPYERIWY